MRAALFYSLLVLLPTAGCASDRDAIDKRMAAMREDITHMQAENDRLGERVDALEAKNSAPAKTAPAAEAKVERAPLKVVKLVPGDGPAPTGEAEPTELAADERPDAPGTRPVIRLRGKAEEGRAGPASKRQNSVEDSQ